MLRVDFGVAKKSVLWSRVDGVGHLPHLSLDVLNLHRLAFKGVSGSVMKVARRSVMLTFGAG